MSSFTRIGANLWDWEPFTALDPEPRNLWLALYTSAQARRVIPGLWHGGIQTMAESSHRPVDETLKSLDALLDVEMVEFDQKHRVLRMTQLPDAGEFPTSPGILSSWWSKFLLVPQCPVRDAHVSLVRWILDRGAATVKKNKARKPSPMHEEIWSTTFGTVAIPLPRRRGMRRLLDADTGTDVQPSLFGGYRDPLRLPLSVLPKALHSGSEQTQDRNKEISHIAIPERVSRPSGEGEGDGDGVLSSSPDPDQGGAGGGGSGEGSSEVKRPLLTLVPSPAIAPFTVENLLQQLRGAMGGVWEISEDDHERLTGEIDGFRRLGYGEPEFALLGDWIRAKGLSPRGAQDLLECRGQLPGAFSRAMAWREETNEVARLAARRSAELREALDKAGM